MLVGAHSRAPLTAYGPPATPRLPLDTHTAAPDDTSARGCPMKAVALQAVGRMELVDIPEPEPGPGDLKLRVRYCGVCGSDLHEYRSSLISMAANRQTPILGHELSATVVGLGPGVEGFAVGDLVGVT